VAVGALGWIGFCYGAVLLAMGERGPALVVYGLSPTLLSLAVLAAGARFGADLETRPHSVST
jgi:Flp pilus assembly pilin Flp